MDKPLQIHKNHHSSCKTVSSPYDSITLLIFQLFASFVNKAILGCFGSSNLLLQRPAVSHSSEAPSTQEATHLTIVLSCAAATPPHSLPMQEHSISQIQSPVPFCLLSPWIIAIIKAAAAWNRFLLSRGVKNIQALSAILAWQVTRSSAPILFI